MERSSGSLGRWAARQNPFLWTLAALAAYAAVSIALSEIRFLELRTTTWDMGIYQQSLWSTDHGRAFFEAPDFETGGIPSFLEVHGSFVLYAIVPVYAAWPSQFTLLAIQSGVVAVAGVPLYFLARDLTRKPWRAFAAAGMFYVYAPTLSANLYDFHVEAFVPVELFLLLFLWNRRAYGWGFAVATLGFLTMEFVPVLFFAVAVFYLVPSRSAIRAWIDRRSSSTVSPGEGSVPTTGGSSYRRWFTDRRVQASLGLLVASLVAYYVLLAVRTHFLEIWLGLPAYAPTGTGYVIGGTPGALGLAASNLSVGFASKLSYWILLLGLLGFLPLRAPRTLLLSAPWGIFTFFSTMLTYTQLGWQYGFLAGPPLIVGFVYALARPVPGPARGGRDAAADPGLAPPEAHRVPVPVSRSLWFVALVVLVAANLALTPINPLVQDAASGGGYRVNYAIPPGFASAEQLAGLVPPGAPVLAVDNLFPLVANDLHAYSLFWIANNQLQLPFNGTHLPPYVLLDQSRLDTIPSWLSLALYNRSDYGVRGIAWTTPAGPAALFASNYLGSAASLGAPPASNESVPLSQMFPGPAGYLASRSVGPTSGPVLASYPGAEGNVWNGPATALPAGTYRISMSVVAWPADVSSPPGARTPVLLVNGDAFGQPLWFNQRFTFGALDVPGGLFAQYTVSLSEPVLQLELRGYALSVSAVVGLVALEIDQVGPPPVG